MPTTPTNLNEGQNRRHPDHSGRKTFNFILGQVADCIKDISPFFERFQAEEIYTKEYLKVIQTYQKERLFIDLVQLAHCDIAYSIVYFGVSHHDLTTFNRIFENKYNQVFLTYLSFVIKNKPHPDADLNDWWSKFIKVHLSNILDKLYLMIYQQRQHPLANVYADLEWYPNLDELRMINEKRPFKYYGGHQFKLGHYYRHLFQSVKYIDEQKPLTYKEKYEYLKTLRAQLSTPEQYLLFFNSISSIGRAWELKQLTGTPFENFNCYLITKYNFIKNIPDTFYIDFIQIKHYYPLVEFEFGSKPEGRIELKKKFR
jgi:hypothetical protein